MPVVIFIDFMPTLFRSDEQAFIPVVKLLFRYDWW